MVDDIRLKTYNPLITSYPKYAHFFTIVGMSEDALFWAAKNYTLFHAYRYVSHCSIDLGGFAKQNYDSNPLPYGPCLESFDIPAFMIGTDLYNFIKNMLVKEYFLCFYINTKNLNFYSYDLNHPILVIGMNGAKGVFYVNDFYPPLSKYITKELKFNDLERGFLECDLKTITLLKKRDTKITIFENIGEYKKTLLENLNKIYHSDFTPYNPFYLKKQIKYYAGLELYLELKENLREYGRKGLHVLMDSKIIIYECLSCLSKYNELPYEYTILYKNLIDETRKLRNLFIKYQVLGDENVYH